ncbi:MAG: DUF748 domain-containing protein [Bacteroidota bacterium]
MKKRYWKTGLSIMLAILILALAIAPVIVKRQAIKRSKELIGRQINIEKLKVNYFSSTIRIIDFILYEADEEESFVTFDTLLVNLAPLRLIRKDMVIQKLYLKGLTAHIWQQDSLYNFTDLLEYHQSEPDTLYSDTIESEPLHYIFSNLELNKARFSYTDSSIDKTIYMRDLSFFIPHIAWNQEEKSEAGIRFNFHREGYFQSALQLDPKEGEFDAQISLNKLYLNEFTDFLKKSVPIDSLSGLVNSNIVVKGDLDEIENSILSGDIELLGFELTDQTQDKLIGLSQLNLSFNEIDLQNRSFAFDSLTLSQPYIHFALFDSSNNFFDLLGMEATQEVDSTQESSAEKDSLETVTGPATSYALNSFVIKNGVIDYTDHRTDEPFKYHLSELAMSVDSISSHEDWIDLYARMLLNNRGKLNAELGVNPQDPMNMTLDIAISDFILSDLNIYSRYYLGSPIIKGDMYYKSKTNITGGQLSSENNLIIENVEVGDKEGGLHDLPLKFAVFLLKDREGVIDLDVPVRGDLKDPKVDVGTIVWNTFKNLIVRAVAAPYDLLADMMGVDPKDIQSIEFAYADTTLTDQRKEQLDLLLSLEEKKKGLGIELIYYNDKDKETEQIYLAEASKLSSPVPPSDSLTLVQTSTDLAELYTQKRIVQVDEYLKLMNDSTRIFISEAHSDAPGNLGSVPKFEVKYSMSEYHE